MKYLLFIVLFFPIHVLAADMPDYEALLGKPAKEETQNTLTPQSQAPKYALVSNGSCLESLQKSTEPICYIRPGFRFDAALVTTIYSYNTQTPVIAEVEYDITHLGQVVFPKGTEIIGNSVITKSGDRVNVTFHTIAYPNGTWFKINGIALTTDGSAGIPGTVKKEKATAPARVLLKTAGAATTVASGQPLAGEMIASIADEIDKDLQEKQTYSITVKKGIPLMVYIVDQVSFNQK